MCATTMFTKIIIWEAAVGEMLVCSRELCNTHDRYAVGVEKNSIVIGQLPRKVAHVWIRKIVDRFQIVQQSHIHMPWICANRN